MAPEVAPLWCPPMGSWPQEVGGHRPFHPVPPVCVLAGVAVLANVVYWQYWRVGLPAMLRRVAVAHKA